LANPWDVDKRPTELMNETVPSPVMVDASSRGSIKLFIYVVKPCAVLVSCALEI
jgi:hypothetical protein